MPQKYDKHWNPLPGYKISPEKKREFEEARELRGEKKRAKLAQKRLKAQGFEFDGLMKRLTRYTGKAR